jgi:hypothetical protein
VEFLARRIAVATAHEAAEAQQSDRGMARRWPAPRVERRAAPEAQGDAEHFQRLHEIVAKAQDDPRTSWMLK